jgi:hypothetical protein
VSVLVEMSRPDLGLDDEVTMNKLGLGVNVDLENGERKSSEGLVRVSYGCAVQRDAIEARIATEDVVVRANLGRGVGGAVNGADDDWKSKFPIELRIVAHHRQE